VRRFQRVGARDMAAGDSLVKGWCVMRITRDAARGASDGSSKAAIISLADGDVALQEAHCWIREQLRARNFKASKAISLCRWMFNRMTLPGSAKPPHLKIKPTAERALQKLIMQQSFTTFCPSERQTVAFVLIPINALKHRCFVTLRGE